MEAIVAARLVGDADLVALCPRITPTIPTPSPSLPFLVYSLSGAAPLVNLDGVSGLCMFTFSVNAITLDYATARAIGDRVISLFHGWSDRTKNVQGCFLSSEESQQILEPDQYFNLQLSFSIWATAL